MVLYTFRVYAALHMSPGGRAAQLLDDLAADGKEAFTTADIEQLGELSPQSASNMLSRLVDLGIVDRVTRGHYVLRPFGALGTRAAAQDVALAVGAAFGGRSHRIAYRSALDWHGLLEHPSRSIVLAVTSRPSLRELSGRRLTVVVERPDRIEVGAESAGHRARVSSVERAILESAARPALAGGIQVVATTLARAPIDAEKLESISKSLGARTALHRLGSIAETLELESLKAKLAPLSSVGRVIQLDPEADKDHGWLDTRWGVQWPFSADELAQVVRR
jgi:predicted transcriptional regulator of viral defense system